jgi:hypothetical protein
MEPNIVEPEIEDRLEPIKIFSADCMSSEISGMQTDSKRGNQGHNLSSDCAYRALKLGRPNAARWKVMEKMVGPAGLEPAT